MKESAPYPVRNIAALPKNIMGVDEFKAQIQKGVDAADRGELLDVEEVFDKLLFEKPTP
jgi:predicted transcriptional regulator